MKKILCLFFSCFILFSLCACSDSDDEPENQIISYNIDNEPVTLDPQIANDSGARLVILNIFEGLVRLDANGSAVPGVAERWDISNDGTVYTFYLRNDACWNDGTAVTADDFVFGITRALLPGTQSPTASTLFCIENAEEVYNGIISSDSLGIKALDEHTLKIQLEYSYSEFLELLATPPAMPCNEDFFEQSAGQYGRDDDMILSNGAFYVRSSSWSHDEYIYLRKNSYYSGQDTPVPAGVNITIGETFEDVCQSISDGTIDCYSLPNNQVSEAQELGFNMSSFGDTVWGIAFNTQNEALQNKNIRCGLLSSLDRNFILETIPENCTTVSDIIPDGAKINGESYRSLVEDDLYIKYSDNAKVTLQKGLSQLKLDSLPKLTILCTDDEATQSIVNNIIETWNKLTGNYINKNPVTRSELDNYIESGNYQIVIAPLTVDGDSPVDTLEIFKSTNSNNIAKLSDSTYDNYINTITKQPDISALDTILEAEKYINDNGIFYPLYIENRYYASAENVTGIIFHPYGAEADFFYATKIPE